AALRLPERDTGTSPRIASPAPDRGAVAAATFRQAAATRASRSIRPRENHQPGHATRRGRGAAARSATAVLGRLLLLLLHRLLLRLLVLVVLDERAARCSHRGALLAADDRAAHAADHCSLRLAVML